MKKKIYSVAVTAMFLASASFAFAQDNPATPPPPPHQGFFQTILNVFRGDRKIDIQTFQEVKASTTEDYHDTVQQEKVDASTTVQFRDERASTTADYRGDMQDNRQNLKTNVMSITDSIRTVQMFRISWIMVNATAVRLQKILVNLNTRIAKINSAGGDTTTATGLSATASTTLSVAQTDITNIKMILDSVSSTTPLDGTATTTIAADFKDAQTNLQTSQMDMEQAVQNLMQIHLSTASSTHQ